MHDRIPWAGHVNYVAAKAGAAMIMRKLAQAVAHQAIRMNSVAPGAIRAPINAETWGSEQALAELLLPGVRIGEPEVVAWLASDAADYGVVVLEPNRRKPHHGLGVGQDGKPGIVAHEHLHGRLRDAVARRAHRGEQ
ncbi:SDR family oxidoreductase [Methylobacterium radiotolerans]|uniref:SDR family oxidoreductase n=1 Tax=Methylobacterium radiotolerans TaxID=31998 RepID=UPI00399C8A0F